jgi:hypothetical protein
VLPPWAVALAFALKSGGGVYIHAERLLAKAGGSKRKGRGISHPWNEAKREWIGRRAAQAKRGSLGTPLAGARGGAPECTSHLRYKTDQGPALHTTWNPCLVLRTMMRYALERESYRGSTSAIPVEYQKEEMSVSELCREFGVSRPTGYRWINRYKESGPEGLLNLSSKPHGCSHATPETIENAILALRGKYPSWEQGS